MTEKAPNYLISLIPKSHPTIKTRNSSIPTFHCRTDCFKYSFFPSTLNYWFSLDIKIRNSESTSLFKSRLLSFIRPVQNNIYNIFDPEGIISNSIASRPKSSKYTQISSCSLETGDTTHYLLHCRYFSNQRTDLMNSVNSVVQNFEFMSENNKEHLLLFGASRFEENKN